MNMSDPVEPKFPCVDKNGMALCVGAKIRLLHYECGYIDGVTEAVKTSVRIGQGVVTGMEYTRNIWGEEYWVLHYKGSPVSGTCRAHECEAALNKPTTLWAKDFTPDRQRIAAWIRSNPSKDIPCTEHDHGPRHKCFVSVPMTVQELADAILKGEYP